MQRSNWPCGFIPVIFLLNLSVFTPYMQCADMAPGSVEIHANGLKDLVELMPKYLHLKNTLHAGLVIE